MGRPRESRERASQVETMPPRQRHAASRMVLTEFFRLIMAEAATIRSGSITCCFWIATKKSLVTFAP